MVIPWLQFRSKSIIRYNEYPNKGRFIRTERQRSSAKNLTEQNTYTGILCPGARKRLTKSLELMIQYAKPKEIIRENGHKIKFSVNFVTLTIYSYGKFIPGKEAQKTLLEPFLKWMKYNYKVRMYLWKAELQTERKDVKQLHFHLTTDVYIPWKAIRAKWNELQKQAGYLQSFYKRHHHWDPNSTDVHALYRIGNPVGYIKKAIDNYSKTISGHLDRRINTVIGNKEKKDWNDQDKNIVDEITKDLQNKLTVGGKVWDCSLNLKAKENTYFEAIDLDELAVNLERAVKQREVSQFNTDICTIFKVKRGYSWQLLPKKQQQEYFRHGNKIYDYHREPPGDKKRPPIKGFKPTFYQKPIGFSLFSMN